jgi:hypothetical protein
MKSADTETAQIKAGTSRKSSQPHTVLVMNLVANRRPTINTSMPIKKLQHAMTPVLEYTPETGSAGDESDDEADMINDDLLKKHKKRNSITACCITYQE